MSALSTSTPDLTRVIMVDPCPYDSSLFSALDHLEEGGRAGSLAVEVDSDDDEVYDTKKAPSKSKAAIAIGLASIATLTAIYYEANPIITVGLVNAIGSMSKSFLRRIPRPIRYTGIGVALASGIAFDTLVTNRLQTAAIFGGIALSCICRTAKLFILGKTSKDK
jgi:hypothetical protein